MEKNKFKVGDIVHHKRYDYRGVVIEHDASCRADEAWYQKNQTQPNRDQPWYHVLVDGGASTYVAQGNLEPDGSKAPISHPLVSRAFSSYYEGRYYKESMN